MEYPTSELAVPTSLTLSPSSQETPASLVRGNLRSSPETYVEQAIWQIFDGARYNKSGKAVLVKAGPPGERLAVVYSYRYAAFSICPMTIVGKYQPSCLSTEY